MSYKKAEKNIVQRQGLISRIETKTYSVDILALELGDQLLETVILSLNANGRENLLDISGRRGGVATDLEEEVCSEMTHLFGGCKNRSEEVSIGILSVHERNLWYTHGGSFVRVR